MTATLSSADMVKILAAANGTVAEEYTDHDLVCTQGAVPPDLDGILYRNGPGRLERGGLPYGHAFDGDGHVQRLACAGGRVRYTNRFVRTPDFVAEEAAGRLLYRGFGTNRPGGVLANALRLRFKNTANTNVIWHGGQLLALWDGGLPYRLDPAPSQRWGRMTMPGGCAIHFRASTAG
ncbi:carotenoid oxygenase family protein [uncultured Thiodictyon sp.]|jgi:all-trans-8'-apo-beta-carotenal 15,15'-oxygenase|uniref:carotenoid oxygenase family protein n=1 Tax=uncultured Thiodictyon sp. TaxID=1846217 RepID=UPI0025D3E5E7|nr:carotenoid oxygenase family protein [uncultured Thiodictyon sp.]